MQSLSFERQLDPKLVANMINIRVHAGLPGFIGRFVQPNEINDYSIRVIKRDFDDPEKRHAVLQHVYQSITGGF